MEGNALRKPVKVPVFIKAARWGLLTYGIFYGQIQWDRYHKRQKHLRDEHAKIWPAIQEEMKAVSLANKTAEMKGIAKELGIELPPGWTAEGL